jgi:predicted MFS family arabinose efflux permease
VQNRWIILGVLFLARTTMALQFQSVASVGPSLMTTLAIDFATLGLLIGLYMLPGTVLALPGGVLAQRFGAKRIVLIGLALMTAGGLVMALAASFHVVLAGRILSGAGAVFLTVLVAKMVTDWFAGRELVAAMAILIASWPFGLAVGLVLFGPLAEVAGWNAVMLFGALAAFAALVLVALIYREPPGLPPATASLVPDLTRHEWLLVLVAGAIWGFYNVAYIVLISFVPELFTTRGYSFAQASRAVSLVGWVLIVAVPLWGFLIERPGRPMQFVTAALIVLPTALVALPFVDMPLLPFAIIALATGVPAGLMASLPAQVVRPQARAGGMGVFYMCYFIAMATLPGVAGLARDLSGSPATPALFSAGMVLCSLIALGLFQAARRTKET